MRILCLLLLLLVACGQDRVVFVEDHASFLGSCGDDASVDSPSDVTADDAVDEISESSADVAPDVAPDASPIAPTLVQHVSSSVNPLGQGETGNRFRFTLPNAVGAGNALILGMSYAFSSHRTVSVTDSNGNTWPPVPAVSATDGADMTSAAYVLPNAAPGVTTVTVTFDASIEPFQYTISEFAGVGGVDATSSARTTGSNYTAGTLSPSSGDLVWSYFADIDTGNTHQATGIAPGAGFTLLDADIAWPAQGMPHGSEYAIASGGSMTPGMTITQSSHDQFLGLAVSLQASSSGTLPGAGIRIVRIAHNTSENPPSTWNVQLPSVGNLLVLSTADWAGLLDITSITDINGNTWVKSAFTDGSPQVWYAANAMPSQTLKLTLHISGSTAGASLQLWDIVGAAATPFDVMTGVDLTNDNGGANLTGVPGITPTTAGLTIAVLALGQGPSSGLLTGSPAGAFFDFVYYAGETDFDTMDNADGTAHVYNADTSPESWNWVIANGSTTTEYSATSVHFKGAP